VTRMVVRLWGIADDKPGTAGCVARPHGGGYVLRPREVSGPKDIRDRDVEVFLSREDVARILGRTPALDLTSDPDVFTAYRRIHTFLTARSGLKRDR
jgi:hypothetical protein